MHDELIDNERRIMDALCSGDAAAVAEFTRPDMILINEMGSFSGAALHETMRGVRLTAYSMDSVHTLDVGRDTVIVSYRLQQTGTAGRGLLPSVVYSSSVWRRFEEGWRVIFHQESPPRRAVESSR